MMEVIYRIVVRWRNATLAERISAISLAFSFFAWILSVLT